MPKSAPLGSERFTAHDRAVLGAGSIPNHDLYFTADSADENYLHVSRALTEPWGGSDDYFCSVVRQGNKLCVIDDTGIVFSCGSPGEILIRRREMAWQRSGWAGTAATGPSLIAA